MENVYPSEPIFVPSPDAKVSHCIFAVIATYFCNSYLICKYVQIFVSELNFFSLLGSQEEDDGVVLSALVWGRGMEREVGILVLNASTWQELCRATFTTPGPVPKCLHGWFAKDVDIT